MSDIATDTEPVDRHEAFIASIESKYAANDEAARDDEDGVSDDDEAESSTSSSTTTDDTAGQPAAGTSPDPDGDDGESDDDPEETEDGEHPDGAKPAATDSTDSGESTAGEQAGEDDDDLTDATKLLQAKGAELKLEDVPEQYRPIVEKQIKSARAAFSRVMQEQTAFRTERTQIASERKFIAEHPELHVVELMRQHPDLLDKVDAHLQEIGDDEVAGKKFDDRVKETREKVSTETATAMTAAQEQYDRAVERADAIVATGKELAAKAGVPWKYAERAMYDALQGKPQDQRDLTDAEISAIIAGEAKELSPTIRASNRAASKTAVQNRSAARKAAPASPAKKAPVATRPAAPAPAKPTKVDLNDDEQRIALMMESARRILPGKK